MEILAFVAIFCLIHLLIFLFLHKNKSKPSKTSNPPPPGPPGLPFIGNLHQLDISCLYKYLWELSKQYGPLMLLQLGSIPTLVISSAIMAEEVMKNQDLVFCSRPKMVGHEKMSYNRLDVAFAPYSQEWREMRKISVLHLLSTKRVQQFRPIREDEARRMVKMISKKAEMSEVVDLSDTMVSVTSTTICRVAFGKRWDEGGKEKRRFHELVDEVQVMFMGFFFSDFFPSISWLDRLTGMHSRLEKIFKKFDSFYQELIDEHLDPNRPKSMDDDIIDLMLQLQKSRDTSFDLTMDHIKALLMNVFLAGTDTSAVTVIWAMAALIQNPNIMKKLQTEIREVIGKKQMINEDDVEKLPYLQATVKETMRLYPAVPLLVPRETMAKCTIDGYEIQPKTMVYVSTFAIGRDPEIWENATEFSPDRFLNSTIDLKGQDYQLVPFGSGRRGCPGYLMGLSTVQLLLANLLYSFDWDLPSGVRKEDFDSEALPGLTMKKKNALKLVPKITSSVL